VPAMLELRDRAGRLYRNPHPDPQKAADGVHASATFELEQRHFDDAAQRIEQTISAADLTPGAPIVLSGVTANPREQFS
jgi:hypothetical protein